MPLRNYSLSVQCPTVEKFAKRYPQYGPFAKGKGRVLFELIISPESFISSKVATDLGFSAVLGVAEACSKSVKKSGNNIDNFTKQFIGAVVCLIMENNGYQKTGKKKSIPHPDFSRGEVYILNNNNNDTY